jgi:hypothetical protein
MTYKYKSLLAVALTTLLGCGCSGFLERVEKFPKKGTKRRKEATINDVDEATKRIAARIQKDLEEAAKETRRKYLGIRERKKQPDKKQQEATIRKALETEKGKKVKKNYELASENLYIAKIKLAYPACNLSPQDIRLIIASSAWKKEVELSIQGLIDTVLSEQTLTTSKEEFHQFFMSEGTRLGLEEGVCKTCADAATDLYIFIKAVAPKA